MLKRPWLASLAEGAGKFVITTIRKPLKKQRPEDADTAAWVARWAHHWAALATGEEEMSENEQQPTTETPAPPAETTPTETAPELTPGASTADQHGDVLGI
jgi:hypothetical protein